MSEGQTLELTGQAGRRGKWSVSLEAEALTFTALKGDESFGVRRADADEKIDLQEPWFSDPLLVVTVAKKKVIFKLKRAQLAPLKKWFGPPTIRRLKAALKRRLAWNLPVGILFIITSLPLAADPESGAEAVPFDAVSAGLGASLIAIGILARLWPRRILLLLDALWYLFLAADVAFGIFRGDSPLWTILIVILLVGAKVSFDEYRRFANLSNQDEILRADQDAPEEEAPHSR